MTAIACDFGGTRIKLGLVQAGQILARTVVAAQSDRPLSERLPAVAQAIDTLCGEAGMAPRACLGVGVSFPSIVHPDGRVLGDFGKYGAVSLGLFAEWAQKQWGLDACIENDARLALVGEWQQGAAAGFNNAAMVTLGTGIGTAAMVEGQVVVGAHGQAAILGGHQTVNINGRVCGCGNIGCAEAEASSSVLPALIEEISQSVDHQGWPAISPKYEDVFLAANQGDPIAQAVVSKSLAVWGSVAVQLVHGFDPEVVVLGGGVMGSKEVILPAIAKHVAKHAHTPWGSVQVVASELGDDAALVGADWLVRQRLRASG